MGNRFAITDGPKSEGVTVPISVGAVPVLGELGVWLSSNNVAWAED